jgi:hypothetical protein
VSIYNTSNSADIEKTSNQDLTIKPYLGKSLIITDDVVLGDGSGGLYTPQVFLKLDDNSATDDVVDSSGSARNGVLNSGSSSTLHTTGKNVDAFTGMGAAQYANNFGGYKATGDMVFFCAWLKSAADPTLSFILMQDTTPGGGVEMLAHEGYIKFRVGADTAYKTMIYDDAWHLACGSFDNSASGKPVRIWIDDVEGTASTHSGSVPSADSSFTVGSLLGAMSWSGGIDGVRVYNDVSNADADELAAAIWNGGSGTDTVTLAVGGGGQKRCIDANVVGTDPTTGICWNGDTEDWSIDNNVSITGVVSVYGTSTHTHITQDEADVATGNVKIAGELQITGVTGSGKAVCVKADKTLGTCADAVGAGGTCTCE